MPPERPVDQSRTTQATPPDPRRPDLSRVDQVLGEIAATRGQATKAAKTASEILAILTNSETAVDPVYMIESLLKAITEQGEALRRIEAKVNQIEARLPARS